MPAECAEPPAGLQAQRPVRGPRGAGKLAVPFPREQVPPMGLALLPAAGSVWMADVPRIVTADRED